MSIRIATSLSLLCLAITAACGGGDFGDGEPSGEGLGGDTEGTELPNQLTAGEWDDNEYFEFFLDSINGMFSEDKEVASVDLRGRVIVTASNEIGAPLSNATIEVFDDRNTYLTAPTGSDGRVLYLPNLDGAPEASASLQVRISPQDAEPVVQVAPSGSEWQLTVTGAPAQLPTNLDLAFVIDATGSMSDELEYVKAEVASISAGIQGRASDVLIRYGLVVYRDEGDEYTVRSFDFTSDLTEFRSNLNAQRAGGGGDYPEAMDKALETMNQLEWMPASSNAVRMAFLIADAPSHDETAQDFLEEANLARTSGIKIYPVAASGVGQRAEYLMRVAAGLSLARYIFLTDDSGVGDSHEEPHIPCYQVELLNGLMVRTALSELGGAYIGVEQDSIVRTVGEYDSAGRCIVEAQQ